MDLTPDQHHILTRMKAGTVLEQTWLDGHPLRPAYRLGGVMVDSDAVMGLEAAGYIHPVLPDVLLRIGYSLYELRPAGSAAI